MYFTNHHQGASIFYEKNGWTPWKNPLKGCDLKKKNIFHFILQIATRERRFSTKKWMSALEKHLKGMRFYEKIFFILFYKSPQESVDFLQKNGCPPWKNTLKGCDYIKKYFLFYFTNHHKRALIFYKKWTSSLEQRLEGKWFYEKKKYFILLMRSPKFLYRLWRGLR